VTALSLEIGPNLRDALPVIAAITAIVLMFWFASRS